MFLLNVTALKSYEADGKFFVEGIASDSAIDLENERFSDSCIKQMEESIKKGNIPLRSDHSRSWRDKLGKLIDAQIVDKSKLKIKALVDDGMSAGKDLIHSIKSGEVLGLSVQGNVSRANFEFDNSLGKSITVYEDIELNEVSVTATPANPRTTLSIAKSIKKSETGMVEASEEAKELAKMVGVKKMLSEIIGGKDMKKCIEDCESCGTSLSSMDFFYLLDIFTMMNELGVQKQVNRPAKLDDMKFYEKLTQENYVLFPNGEQGLPHHDLNYAVDKELVNYYLYILLDGQSYVAMESVKNFHTALSHLHHHLISSELKPMKNEQIKKEEVVLDTEVKPVVKTEEVVAEAATVEAEVVKTEEAPKVDASGEAVVAKEEPIKAEAGAEAVETEVKVTKAEEVVVEVKAGEVLKMVAELAGVVKELSEDVKALKGVKKEEVVVETKKEVEEVKEVVVEKSADTEVAKTLDKNTKLLEKSLEVLNKIAEMSAGRRSVAFSVVEKTVETPVESTTEIEIKKHMAAGKSFTEAYKLVKKVE
jgi:HK97 family phage prohead protease